MKELYSHWDEMRLLFRGGKLWKKDKWRNADEHQITQLFGAKILGELMGLSEDERIKFEKVALVHDWRKRLDKWEKNKESNPNEFTQEDIERAEVILRRVNPDEKLMAATGPDFLEKVLYGEVSVVELLQFYLDDITKGNEIVRFDERIDEVSKRKGNLNDSVELTERLGGRKYWNVEREVGHEVEKMIFNRLIERGIEIDSPEEIPALIRSRMGERQNG